MTRAYERMLCGLFVLISWAWAWVRARVVMTCVVCVAFGTRVAHAWHTGLAGPSASSAEDESWSVNMVRGLVSCVLAVFVFVRVACGGASLQLWNCSPATRPQIRKSAEKDDLHMYGAFIRFTFGD